MKHLVFSLVVLAQSGGLHAAELPMSGAEFEAYTQGKTLTYMDQGQSYGVEEYRPGRRVKWAFNESECQDGEWYEPEAGLICFVYEDSDGGPQCWHFFRRGGGLMARFANDPIGTELYETQQSRDPLFCPGPEVGV